VAVIGYKLSSEEHPASDLVRYAARAEDAGFEFLAASDHFHPWLKRQGHSPFVWSTLAGVAQATESIPVGTAVTCPTVRMHPAIVAHAAATVATMLPGRFWLGLGTGENLNEHIVGQHWPTTPVRREMLAEAIELIRLLWRGGSHNFRGRYYTVERAEIFDLPDEPVPIYVAAAGPGSIGFAAEVADGLVSIAPKPETVRRFEEAGGNGKPRYAEFHVCFASGEDEAKETAHRLWSFMALPGELSQELKTPKQFEEAVSLVDPEQVAEVVACGPDPEVHVSGIREYLDAGFDHVFVHQIGPDQEGFFRFYEKEVLPELR
jgi:G6PDH family F420-dependent oxidoreductase